jgi:nitrite reductase (NADH) large subunit
MDTLMERQLDKPAGALLKASLEEKGMKFLMEAQTEAVLGKDKVESVRFKDGLEIPADIVVMAVGIKPNIELAKKIGLHCERGIVVNDTMQTFDPRIYSVGECLQHRGQTYGLVAPLFEQAKVCANHLAHLGIARYEGSITSTKLKVTGIDLFSAGDFHGDDDTEELVLQDPGRGVYKKVVLRDHRIIGAVMYGDTIDGTWYFELMRDNTDVSDIRDNLLFGQAHLGDSGHGDDNRVRATLLTPLQKRICSRWMMCVPTPRHPVPAAPVPVWWKPCWRIPWVVTTRNLRPKSRCVVVPSSPTTISVPVSVITN